MRHWAGALGLALLGGVIGLVGAFVQAQRTLVELPWGSLFVPWGTVLVWICLVAAIRGGAWALESRWGGSAVLAGWLVLTVVMSAESPSGDLALAGGGRQFAYLFVGVVVGSAAATLPVRLRGGTRNA